MPAKITFTQKEESSLKTIIEYLPGEANIGSGSDYTAELEELKKLLAKMQKARAKSSEPAFHGVAVSTIIAHAQVALGNRLKCPEILTKEWFIKMQRAVNSSGITEAIADQGIAAAAKTWQGDIWIENLVWNLSKLAAGVHASGGARKSYGFSPTKKSGWLAQLEEE